MPCGGVVSGASQSQLHHSCASFGAPPVSAAPDAACTSAASANSQKRGLELLTTNIRRPLSRKRSAQGWRCSKALVAADHPSLDAAFRPSSQARTGVNHAI
ncbi:hypothetical protein OBBRIDRAFT_654272 [Obba rivulosa]|uniref:Uncharacterized protein n=1 Tax=Obba rivulosa TaxID=1052685 RepID=A0A8E2AZV1_9APHY|nr:hypothetical protein OBBRIDRAFT_654272 [Obba rivulosa]